MEDYEIRDTMGRGQYPKIELAFAIEKTKDRKQCIESNLKVVATNIGQIYAQYVIIQSS